MGWPKTQRQNKNIFKSDSSRRLKQLPEKIVYLYLSALELLFQIPTNGNKSLHPKNVEMAPKVFDPHLNEYDQTRTP